MSLQLKLLPLVLSLGELLLELLVLVDQFFFLLRVQGGPILGLHELGAQRFLLSRKLTLEASLLLLALLLEFFLFFFERCDLVLDILQLGLHLLLLDLLGRNLGLQG